MLPTIARTEKQLRQHVTLSRTTDVLEQNEILPSRHSMSMISNDYPIQANTPYFNQIFQAEESIHSKR